MLKQKVVVDSYAWIEYFIGSEKGERVKKMIENPSIDIITPSIVVAEVTSITKREQRDVEEAYSHMTTNTQIITLDAQQARKVGEKHAEIRKTIKDFGMADVIILMTAQSLNAKIITGDPHFKGMKEVSLFLE